ncbi:hypothetical protein LOAG_09490 [Loa loa]|uniref:Uncharacterized protein n=1 Tax=Loa loa TaxID=7209 RepID=A0A1S0TRU1_LOALO|nr:hypothetical protein LOAG_09490 [Loa loa]EFO19005.1 hypothetical protein LOAG_09490 [Loa loa]
MYASRHEFYNLMKEWAKKYQILESTNKFINQEIEYEKKLGEILMQRFRSINGTIKAKKILFKIIKLQENMNVRLIKIEKCFDNRIALLSIELQQEVINLWQMIYPHDIYKLCIQHL